MHENLILITCSPALDPDVDNVTDFIRYTLLITYLGWLVNPNTNGAIRLGCSVLLYLARDKCKIISSKEEKNMIATFFFVWLYVFLKVRPARYTFRFIQDAIGQSGYDSEPCQCRKNLVASKTCDSQTETTWTHEKYKLWRTSMHMHCKSSLTKKRIRDTSIPRSLPETTACRTKKKKSY